MDVEREEGARETVGYGRRMASGSLLNLVSMAVVFLCGFLLTPFLLDRLGTAQYAIFVLAQSVVGFFTLLNLGVPASLSHLLSRSLAREDSKELSRSFSAGLTLLLYSGAAALVIGLVLVLVLPRIFQLAPESVRDARWVFLLLTLQMAVSFPLLAYRTIYQATQRFTIPSWIRIVLVPTRTAAIFLLFLTGHVQLLVWAGIHVASEMLEGFFLAARSRRILPSLRTSLRAVSPTELRGLVGFSSWIFLGSVGYLLYHNTDYLLIHWFIGPEEVAHYNLAARWDPLLRGLVGTIANPLVPVSAALWASRKEDEVRHLFLRTSRYVMALALPSCLLLSVFSKPFLIAWAGPAFGRDWRVLVILMVPLIFSLAHGPIFSLYVGLGKTRMNGILTIVLAVINVILSLYFVRVLGWGLEGIALGTALTYFLRTGLISPWYVCRLTGLPLGRYVGEVIARPLLAAVPMVAVAWALRLSWELRSLPEIALAMGLSVAAFCLPGWWLLLSAEERRAIPIELRKRFR